MKNNVLFFAVIAGAAILAGSGCNKQDSTTQASAGNSSQPAKPVASEMPKAAATPKPAPAQPTAAAPKPDALAQTPAAAAVASTAVTPAETATKPMATPPAQATVQTPPPAAAPSPAPATANPLLSGVQNLVDAQKVSVTQAATNQFQALGLTATNQAQAAALAATNQVQALLDKAKGLVSNQKYQDALTTVQQLYATKLTPAQQQTVDGLKTQIQTALSKGTATNAISVLGNILGGKK